MRVTVSGVLPRYSHLSISIIKKTQWEFPRAQRHLVRTLATVQRGKNAVGRLANFYRGSSTSAAGQHCFLHKDVVFKLILLRPPLQSCMDSKCEGLELNNTDLCPQDCCDKGDMLKICMESEKIQKQISTTTKTNIKQEK